MMYRCILAARAARTNFLMKKRTNRSLKKGFNQLKYFYRRSRRTIKENYRETEKAVLDSILGKGYDKRIRPSGQNITGNAIDYYL